MSESGFTFGDLVFSFCVFYLFLMVVVPCLKMVDNRRRRLRSREGISRLVMQLVKQDNRSVPPHRLRRDDKLIVEKIRDLRDPRFNYLKRRLRELAYVETIPDFERELSRLDKRQMRRLKEIVLGEIKITAPQAPGAIEGIRTRSELTWRRVTNRAKAGLSSINVFRHQRSIKTPPGYNILYIGETLFSAKTFRMIIQPIVADMQFDYYNALARAADATRTGDDAERKRQELIAFLARSRVWGSLASALGWNFAWSLVKGIFAVWKA